MGLVFRARGKHVRGGWAGQELGEKCGFSPCIKSPGPCQQPHPFSYLLPALCSSHTCSPLLPRPTGPFLSLLIQAMAVRVFFSVVRNIIIQQPQMVNRELDEATRERMWQREEMLRQEMTRLLQELEQNDMPQRNLLFTAMLQWQSWAVALVVLLGLWWWLRYLRNHHRIVES